MNEWRKIENNIEHLNNICLNITDGTHASPKKQNFGKPLITSKHLKNGKILVEEANLISEQDFKKINERSKVNQWDVLISMIGTVGELAIVKEEPKFAIKNIGLFNIGNEFVAKWVYYYFNSTKGKNEIFTKIGGSTQQYITLSELRNLKIYFPAQKIREKIIKILSDIDNKIELNNKINNNLEEQCITIFKKMFPQIFYGSFNVGNYLKPKRGKNLLSKNAILGDIPVVAGGLEPAIYHNKSNTQSPVITISASGANAGFIRLWHTPVWSSDSSYIDYSVSKYIYFWYLFLKLRQKEIYDLQSGSAQPHIYPKHLEELSINKLDIKLIETFDEITSNFFEKIGKNNTENNKLTNLKNYLLPKLMNGEIDVENIEL